jgi:hypothetical protein
MGQKSDYIQINLIISINPVQLVHMDARVVRSKFKPPLGKCVNKFIYGEATTLSHTYMTFLVFLDGTPQCVQ